MNVVFLALVAVLFGLAVHWSRSPKFIAALVAWLALTALAAASGWLAQFEALPPHIFAVLIPAIAGTQWLARSRFTGAWLERIQPQWLYYAQSFRVVMELILLGLYHQGLMPKVMTFEGRNLEILTGLSAPLVGYLCFQRRTLSPTVARVWNFFGLATLLNVVGHGLLSFPAPFRLIHDDFANAQIAYFPFVWLVAFVVPFAVFLHLVSLRQLRHRGSVSDGNREITAEYRLS